MKKLLFFLLPVICLYTKSTAQTNYPYVSIGFNPLSPAESMSSIGPCVSYRVSPTLELWGETSFIFHNLYSDNSWKNLRGYRFIFQPRFYTGKNKTFFIAPEFRLKQYSYNNSLTFLNKTTADTLRNYPHKASQVLIGGAFILGSQFSLSSKHNFFIEITAGVGGKQRYIDRKNIPDGYKYYVQPGGFGLAPHYEWDNDGTAYFVFGFRLIWKLQNHK